MAQVSPSLYGYLRPARSLRTAHRGRYHIIVTFTGASQGQTVGPRPLSYYYRRVLVINRLVLRATELLEPPTRQSSATKELHCSTEDNSLTSRRLRGL
ncbi:hypothetical protein HDV64DRAFT_212555 [Trichoderma sp. TUCIM 5745]